MVDVRLTYNYGYKWFSDKTVFVKGTALHDEVLLSGTELLRYFKDTDSESDFKQKLINLNGLFSVVIVTKDGLMASVDRIRNFPLLYTQKGDLFIISDDYKNLLDENATIDNDAKIDMSLSGWVPGKKTLIRNIFQIQAEEYLIFEKGKIRTGFWQSSQPINIDKQSKEEWKLMLRECFLRMGENLAKAIAGRPVMLPLSGGFDSRLIALLLKQNGVQNVFCFTYGNGENKEGLNSKEIAKRLDYPWIIVDYKSSLGSDFTHTDLYKNYAQYAGNAISFPYIQEYFAALYLKENDLVPENAVFIPGHSGDTIAGAHIFPDIKHIHSLKKYAKLVSRTYGRLVKHDNETEEHFLKTIETEAPPYKKINYFLYKDWDKREFQAKQLVNSAKIWNYIGYEHLLPLSDNLFMDFFAKVPLKYQAFKNLYDETLKELYTENNLLLSDEVSPSQWKRRYRYYKVKLRTYFPILSKLGKYRKTGSFFYFDKFASRMQKEIPKALYKSNNGILTAYYIKQVEDDLKQQ